MEEIQFEGSLYKVSFETMPTTLKNSLSEQDLTRYLELLEQVQTKPRAIYKEVKAFCASHNTVPEVINLLTFAHIRNHRVVEAEKLIEETYQKNPDYLFAMINYADQCVRKKKLDKVTEIFPTFDLKQLFPKKEIFHTSEFRGFLIMMTYYNLALKERLAALKYYRCAKEVEPNHPSVIHLESKLFNRSLLTKLIAKWKSTRVR